MVFIDLHCKLDICWDPLFLVERDTVVIRRHPYLHNADLLLDPHLLISIRLLLHKLDFGIVSQDTLDRD